MIPTSKKRSCKQKIQSSQSTKISAFEQPEHGSSTEEPKPSHDLEYKH